MKKSLFLFLLGWLLMIFSCKEDDFIQDSTIQRKQDISFSQLQSKLSSHSISKRVSIPGIMGKNMSDFEIDTTKIVEIKTEKATTYSLKIIPIEGEDGNLYNLYIYDKNGAVAQEIVKYKLDGENISSENTEIIYTERAANVGCIILVIAPCEYGNWHDSDHCEGDGWVTIEIGCDDSSGGSGGGGGSSGGGESGGNDPVTPIGHDPAEGGGSGGGSGSNNNTPSCQSLKNKLNESNFKSRLVELKEHVTNNSLNEYGFVNQNPNEAPMPSPPSQTNQYNPTYSTSPHSTHSPYLDQLETFGYAHTHRHTYDVAGIPSLNDIKIFLDIVRRRARAGLPTDNTYGIVVGGHGIYALKIDNIDDFMAGYGGVNNKGLYSEFWKRFTKDYKKLIEERPYSENTQNENEKALLKLLKKFQFDIGVGVYRATENINGWVKLELNSSNNIHITNCN